MSRCLGVTITPLVSNEAIQIVLSLATLGMTVFLAWYVNYAIKKRLYHEELTEKRLKELYRPMDVMLRASKLAFDRYFSANDEERKFIADLWYNYTRDMKTLITKNAHLFLEYELPPAVDKLLEHIDAFLFDYDQYKQGKKPHPFPGMRDIRFPAEINDYFATRSRQLAESLSARKGFVSRLVEATRRFIERGFSI